MIFSSPSVLLLFLICLNPMVISIANGGLANFRKKRSDIDLQTCISHFDIHRDKIIRTQDSQNMGAKYLNEIDLGSREECLRLCCETENCDVFVFEEKNSGSCYLFHCGPPEDFKCKFTHHVNYSSAVLAVNRHLPDLESQIKLTKHEQDLTKLRKPGIDPDLISTVTASPSTASTTMKISDPKTKPPSPLTSLDEARKCSRYQFECRSTGECIAIYNACDGIPQCSDGSDEAPELGCPDLITTSQPPAPINNPAPPKLDSNIPQSRLGPNLGGPHEKSNYHNQESINNQMQISAPMHQDFLRPVDDPQNLNRLQFNNPPIPQQISNWIPHQSNQMTRPIIQQYIDKNSHIFNHKESGLQVPDGQEISQMQYSDGVNGRDYQKIPPYYGDNNYRQNIQLENWPAINNQDDNNRYNLANNYEQNNKDWHQDNINYQAQIKKEPTPDNYKTTSTDHTAEIKIDKETPKHEQDKMAHELKHSKESMGREVNQEVKIKIDNHKIHHDRYPVAAYKMADTPDLQDGVAETPGGAVLSLTLGLIITFIMAILLGCRLRVKRRMRKGGKSYAHDADYLVNGMYL